MLEGHFFVHALHPLMQFSRISVKSEKRQDRKQRKNCSHRAEISAEKRSSKHIPAMIRTRRTSPTRYPPNLKLPACSMEKYIPRAGSFLPRCRHLQSTGLKSVPVQYISDNRAFLSMHPRSEEVSFYLFCKSTHRVHARRLPAYRMHRQIPKNLPNRIV